MRVIAHSMLVAAAALLAGNAAAHAGHATLGPLAGAAHLHAADIALMLAAVVLLGLLVRGARHGAASGLRALAASGRTRRVGAALGALVLLALLLS